MNNKNRTRRIAGWTAVLLSTTVTGFWAFWGIIENFHEGWYYRSLAANLGLMLVQYLSWMLLFMAVSLVSIYRPRAGALLHFILAGAAVWFFDAFSNAATFLLILPLAGLGFLYAVGRPQPRRRAAALVVGLPLLILVIAGVGPAVRVAGRLDDGFQGARTVDGNGVTLVWAPAGPGWPDSGGTWIVAGEACRNLSEDGLSLAASPQGIWRLPLVEEAVRSMARGGENSGGIWDADQAEAQYVTTPDKESPLWNVYSQVIYWWTATEIDPDRAYILAYDGQVWPRSKDFGPAYLGFRCVKAAP